jgi:SHS2 domain-containing protein
MADISSGFEEIDHTADWALKIWAPDLSELFRQAARGMYALMEIELAEQPRSDRSLALQGVDNEDLLVAFLAELLYFGESENLAFDRFNIQVEKDRLTAQLSGAPLRSQNKEIKAVTYHNLKVQQIPQGFSAVVVFDV